MTEGSLYSPADWETAVALRGRPTSDVAIALAAERTKGCATIREADECDDSRAVLGCKKPGCTHGWGPSSLSEWLASCPECLRCHQPSRPEGRQR